jgi:mRNA interferase RelE/StbE
MNYKLKFLPTALKEWKKLDNSLKDQFKKKFRASDYRLVYEVIDKDLYVFVIAAGKRDKKSVYKKAKIR